MSKGYPTPDTASGDITFSCIPVYVPSNPEFQGIFAAAIYGLYASMARDYFWREQGTMTPQDAAFLAARGLAASQAYDGACGEGGEMSCADVADCIETDETVQQSIVDNVLQNNGFVPNPETEISDIEPLPSMTSETKAMNLLPEGFDCASNPQLVMGLARTIVKELNETTEDVIELIEYSTNGLEAWQGLASVLPSAVTQVAEVALGWVDWLIETLSELYVAAYTQNTEDEITCAIFCHMMDTCSLSLSDLETIYEGEASIGTPPDGLIETLEFIYDVAVSADKIAVAAFHYQILRLLAWGQFANVTAPYLQSLLKSTQGSDYSYEDLCDDCVEETPTDYWMLNLDFRYSQHGTQTINWNGSSNDGRWTGAGYEFNRPATPISTANVAIGIMDFGASFVVRAAATKSVRRGSDGNGTNDINVNLLYTGENQTGSQLGSFNQSGNTVNTNEVVMGLIAPTATQVGRSMAIRSRVNQNTGVEPVALRVYQVVVWGLKGAGDTKPSRAVWAGNTLPTTLADLFELP